MLEINVKEVLARRDRRLKEKPKITIILHEPKPKENGHTEEPPRFIIPDTEGIDPEEQAELRKKVLLDDLETQSYEVRIERAKLSNQYRPLIEGEADQSELAAHYAKIEALTKELQKIYDASRHVEQYGRLPNVHQAESVVNEADIYALKDKKKRLIDRRGKLDRKIKAGEAKNSPKLIEWQMERDKTVVDIDEVDKQLKALRL